MSRSSISESQPAWNHPWLRQVACCAALQQHRGLAGHTLLRPIVGVKLVEIWQQRECDVGRQAGRHCGPPAAASPIPGCSVKAGSFGCSFGSRRTRSRSFLHTCRRTLLPPPVLDRSVMTYGCPSMLEPATSCVMLATSTPLHSGAFFAVRNSMMLGGGLVQDAACAMPAALASTAITAHMRRTTLTLSSGVRPPGSCLSWLVLPTSCGTLAALAWRLHGRTRAGASCIKPAALSHQPS